jgi:hypothetical protein
LLATELPFEALLTVTDGQIRDHETFDCYEPFGTGGQTASHQGTTTTCRR